VARHELGGSGAGWEGIGIGQSSEYRSGLNEARQLANEDVFRHANERIAASAHGLGLERGIPFLCECSDSRCTTLIRLDLDVYEGIRAELARYLAIPGHVIPQAQVIEESEALAVLGK
jgi:hypothetical protein